MKVAFIAHYSGMYGANQSLLTLVVGLRPYGVSPIVFAPHQGRFLESLRQNGIPFEVVPYSYWMSRRRALPLAPYRLIRNQYAAVIISKRLQRWGASLIHSNSSVINIGALVSARLTLPHIWHLREFAELAFGMRFDLGKRHSRQFMSHSNAFIAVSNTLRRYLLDSEDRQRCRVIYNGVLSRKLMHAKYCQSLQRQKNSVFTFAMVGSINPNKGQAVAVKAIKKMVGIHNVRLLLAGTGGSRHIRRLKALSEGLGISDLVDYLGFVEDPFEVYERADAVLVCSKYEGMGRATAEAMSVGLPVIGRDSTGTAELIDHEHGGLLYDGSVEDLVQQMLRLINDTKLRKRLGANGLEKALREFTIEKYCRQVYAVFENLALP